MRSMSAVTTMHSLRRLALLLTAAWALIVAPCAHCIELAADLPEPRPPCHQTDGGATPEPTHEDDCDCRPAWAADSGSQRADAHAPGPAQPDSPTRTAAVRRPDTAPGETARPPPAPPPARVRIHLLYGVYLS